MSLRTRLIAVLAAAATVGVVSAAAVPISAAADTGTVSSTPASYTPWLLRTVVNQNVRRLVPCGDTMYAVGTISAIGQGTSTYTRANAFSFSQTTGAVTAWAPQVNGTVDAVALSPDCSVAYLGGKFTSVDGVTVKNLVAVDTTTGNVITTFGHKASGVVYTLTYTNGQLLVGGTFGSLNGKATPVLASVNPQTGAVTSYANLSFSGTYASNIVTSVQNAELDNAGDKLLIEGVFTTIDGQSRQQAAVLDLGATSLSLDGWYSPDLTQACFTGEPFYVRAATWSPDDSQIYIATTGYKPATGTGSVTWMPRSGLCDAAAAFSSTAGSESPEWINYTGCDSYYSVAADANNVYVAGHERYANNGYGCDHAGVGAVARPGLASLSTTNGLANSWDPTRSRGHGADDMLVTTAGLWIASDNYSDGGAQQCGGQKNHGGICFLPY